MAGCVHRHLQDLSHLGIYWHVLVVFRPVLVSVVVLCKHVCALLYSAYDYCSELYLVHVLMMLVM